MIRNVVLQFSRALIMRGIGIRFFAMRGAQGEVQADCRVDGEDFEPGRLALLKYVETWPARGLEYRKQYVVMQTVESSE